MDARREQATGLFNHEYRSYYKSYDLATGGVDSVYMGEDVYREYIVRRVVPNDASPFYDLFSEDGDYLDSVRLGFTPAPNTVLWVQHGNIYTWVVDELDVQYVVRAPLPLR